MIMITNANIQFNGTSIMGTATSLIMIGLGYLIPMVIQLPIELMQLIQIIVWLGAIGVSIVTIIYIIKKIKFMKNINDDDT